jgi:integrase/recombinase XerD
MKWELDETKFMDMEELDRLRKVSMHRSDADKHRGREGGVREWMLIDVATSTGLRVSEMASLKIGDIDLNVKKPFLRVLRKGSKSDESGKKKPRLGTVRLTPKLREHILEYLEWKESVDEPTGPGNHLLVSERNEPYSRAGLAALFKRAAKRAGLSKEYHIHSCRHSYATYLLKATKNLRLVQKQLGHTQVKTTAIYADVTSEEMAEGMAALDDLYYPEQEPVVQERPAEEPTPEEKPPEERPVRSSVQTMRYFGG